MKLQKPLSALILIASALLLNAANEGAKAAPSPSPAITVQQKNQTQPDKTEAERGAPSVINPGAAHAQSEAGKAQYQPIKISILKDWSDYGLLYVGGLVALITWFQYRVARLTYLVDRPYVIVDEVTLLNPTTSKRREDWTGLTFMVARMRIDNVGKRPAIIEDVRGDLILLPNTSNGFPEAPAYWGKANKTPRASSQKKVIGENTSIELLFVYKSGLFSEEEYKAVMWSYDKILVLFGKIAYRPIAGWHRYKTSFGLRYSPPKLFGDKAFFAVGPARHNTNT